MKELLSLFIRQRNQMMYSESSKLLEDRLSKMTSNLEELLAEAHTDTSHYLRNEIGDMIMLAVAENDEAREKVRSTLRINLILELTTLEAAWARGASEPADKLPTVNTDGMIEEVSSDEDDDDEDEVDEDDSSDMVESSDDDEDS